MNTSTTVVGMKTTQVSPALQLQVVGNTGCARSISLYCTEACLVDEAHNSCEEIVAPGACEARVAVVPPCVWRNFCPARVRRISGQCNQIILHTCACGPSVLQKHQSGKGSRKAAGRRNTGTTEQLLDCRLRSLTAPTSMP